MPKVVELTTHDQVLSLCLQVYPDDKIQLVNPLDYIGTPLPFKDCTLRGIFAHYILNRIPYGYTKFAVADWVRCLRPGSMLHVIVPSLEWLARAVLQDRLEPHVKPLLFGLQTDEHNVGMNALRMTDLRDIFDRAGLRSVKARTQIVSIEVGEEIYEAEQHYVAGVSK